MDQADSELVYFSSSPELVARAEAAFELLRQRLTPLLPEADVQHVGSTAVPGSLTKGDLDVQVRVSAGDFQAAVEVLDRIYDRNDGGFLDEEALSFRDDHASPPLGVHVIVKGSRHDFQHRQRDLLKARPDLRAEYDELKRRFDGQSMNEYRDAKHQFFQRLEDAGLC